MNWDEKAGLLLLRRPALFTWMIGLDTYSHDENEFSHQACEACGVVPNYENKYQLSRACERWRNSQPAQPA